MKKLYLDGFMGILAADCGIKNSLLHRYLQTPPQIDKDSDVLLINLPEGQPSVKPYLLALMPALFAAFETEPPEVVDRIQPGMNIIFR